jgi:hypothetical protein
MPLEINGQGASLHGLSVFERMKSASGKKSDQENHLSPSRRRAFRREIVQTSRVVQSMLRDAPYLGSRWPVAIARCGRK